MSRLGEFAKFACGAEAFHAFVHAALWLSGTTLFVFGIKETPTLHVLGAIVNGLASVALGIYGWRPFGPRSTPGESLKRAED